MMTAFANLFLAVLSLVYPQSSAAAVLQAAIIQEPPATARPIVPTPEPPPPPAPAVNALDHRITISFRVYERQWAKLVPPVTMTFDSASAHLFKLDYFLEGHAPQDAVGHVWRSWLQPTPFGEPERSLRVTWWKYTYSDGSWWVAGAVLNDSIEAPLSRMRGQMDVSLCEPDGTVIEKFPGGDVVIAIQNGFSFSFGTPGRFINLDGARYWLNNFGVAAGLPPEKFWDPVTAPDRIGGMGAWQAQWTPRRIDLKNEDGSYIYPQYWSTSDPRNPPIGATIGVCEVPRLYEDQTHAHHRESFTSIYQSGWQAYERAGDKKLAKLALRAAYQWSARQVGSWSPKLGPPYWIPGRPAYLAGLDGWMPDAHVRYRLTATDTAALKPWIGHEGYLEITKGNDWQFPECFGRDWNKPQSENVITPLEMASGRFAGQYCSTQAWDMEHGGAEQVAFAAIVLADPTAMMHLHLWCEEYLTNGLVKHSSRQVAWMASTALHGYLAFKAKPTFAADAQRYLDYARSIAQWVWQARLDETKYRGLLGRNYSGRDLTIPEPDAGGFEGAFQSAIALNAFTMGAQVDPDPQWRGLWLALVEYTAQLFTQPGIIQRPTPTFKGGVLDSWNLLGPVADAGEWAGKSIDERLRANSGAYAGVDWLADQGWCGPALAKAVRVLRAAGRPSWQAIDELAREIRGYQAVQVYGGTRILGVNSREAWGMYFDSAATYGFAQ